MARYFEGKMIAPAGRYALCVARFNAFITEELLKGAIDTLVRHGANDDNIDVFRCPGTFELPGLVRRVAYSGQYLGVIALGCVIRGGTPHFEYVSGEGTKGIGAVALEAPCPVSFGVLTCDTVEQAIDRAGVKAGNKGSEAAAACIEMASLYVSMAGKWGGA